MLNYDDLKVRLKNKGYKLTRQREAILDAFVESGKPLISARELFSLVILKSPRVNFSTVYRNLEMLVQESIVNKVILGQEAWLYELKIDAEHHHHLICKNCKSVQCTDFCPIEIMPAEHGFIPTEHKLEIYGFCRECVQRRDE